MDWKVTHWEHSKNKVDVDDTSIDPLYRDHFQGVAFQTSFAKSSVSAFSFLKSSPTTTSAGFAVAFSAARSFGSAAALRNASSSQIGSASGRARVGRYV